MATQAEIDECYEVAVELAKRAGAVSECHTSLVRVYSWCLLVPRPSSKEERRVQTPLSSCSVEGVSGDETMFASAMVARRSTPCLYFLLQN